MSNDTAGPASLRSYSILRPDLSLLCVLQGEGGQFPDRTILRGASEGIRNRCCPVSAKTGNDLLRWRNPDSAFDDAIGFSSQRNSPASGPVGAKRVDL